MNTIASIRNKIKNELDNYLINCMYHLRIFNEMDMQCFAFIWLQREIGEKYLIRSTPHVKGCKPDLVVFNNDFYPKIIIELKMKMYETAYSAVRNDIHKAYDNYIGRIRDVDSVIFIVIHDSDEHWGNNFKNDLVEQHPKLHIVSINVRRYEQSGRQREDYLQFREDFDRIFNSSNRLG